jgi:hypothetical protein
MIRPIMQCELRGGLGVARVIPRARHGVARVAGELKTPLEEPAYATQVFHG